MRHAKSDWSNSNLRDIERPLNKRGKKDAPRMGEALSARGCCPDLILLSPSERTNRTAEGLIRGIGKNIPEEIIDKFYPGGPEAFTETLQEWSDRADTILILAHNPGIENFVMQLTGRYHKMPTAAAALFYSRDGEWQLQEILRPRELQSLRKQSAEP